MTADPIVVAARFLAANAEWMRHRPEWAEFAEDVERCARVVRGLARGPAEQKYLGPCGAHIMIEHRQWEPMPGVLAEEATTRFCDGDVYAPRGGSVGRCRTCGTEVSTGDREAWLDGEVRSHAFRAAHIADAYGVNVKTIRTWAARGQLRSYWRTEGELVIPWTEVAEERDAIRLHYVGDVLDLAAADAARRETNRATRERRAAAKAAESEEAA